jgi:lipoate-protein ligase A
MHLLRDRDTEGGTLDVAVSHALLQRAAGGELPPTLRLYRPAPTVAFGRLDRLRPGFADAVTAAGAHGFEPVVRLPGGHAAAYTEHSLGIDVVSPDRDPIARVHERFRRTAELLAGALAGLGVDAHVGEVPGEYCPGPYSVNARRRVKLAATAQRLVHGAWLLSGVVVVRDGARVREVLADVYDRLELEWDPQTAAAVEDEVPGIDVGDVERAVVAAYGAAEELIEAALDAAVLALARRLEPEHRPG